jgi:hypothetical protein
MTVIAPVEVTCPDCDRTFSLITDRQLTSMHAAGDRCPTCAFNVRLKALGLPDAVYERFKRVVRLFHADDPRHPEYARSHK